MTTTLSLDLLIEFTVALSVNFLIAIGSTIGAFAIGFGFMKLKQVPLRIFQWIFSLWRSFTIAMPAFVLLFVMMFIVTVLFRTLGISQLPSPILITTLCLSIGFSAAVIDYLVQIERDQAKPNAPRAQLSDIFSRVYAWAFSGSGMGAAIGSPDSVRFVLNLANTLTEPVMQAWLMFGFCLFLATVVYGVNEGLRRVSMWLARSKPR